MVTWNDIDNSGSVDLVVFYRREENYFIKAFLNDFVPDDVCKTSNRGIFPYSNINLTSTPSLQLPQEYQLFEQSIPRFNDVNADGFPDILTMM